MTKKTGLFDVNIDLDSIMLNSEQTVNKIGPRTLNIGWEYYFDHQLI